MMEALYIETRKRGILKERIQQARQMLTACTLCPRKCGVDRISGETGVCKTGEKAWVSSFGPHFGEESPLVGTRGSGTIFFTHCNLLCLFCQNFDISHEGAGEPVSAEQLARIMLDLQKQGCHNINFVTPSHVVPQILEALDTAAENGLCIPLVYNTSAYDRVRTLKLLEGIVDIYMPDFKFWDSELARKACNAADYPEAARKSIREMHRQVGDLVMDEEGLARQGLLIRHLVLPRGLAGTREIMRFVAKEISADTYVNVMHQYRPCGRAAEVEGLGEYPSRSDCKDALRMAEEEGIWRMDRPRRVFVMA